MENIAIPVSAKVPCSNRGLLTFSWGLGTELRLCEIQHPVTGEGGSSPFKSTVVWSAPSPSHKVLAHAVASAQEELVLKQNRGKQITAAGHDVIAPELLSFCKKVRQALAKERVTEEGNLIALEHAVWGLLEVFFIDANRSGGFIAEDLAAWLADNGSVIDSMMGRTCLQSRLEALLSSPRPDVLDDYWPCFTHLVSLGRTKDALKLLDVHDVRQGHIGATHPSMMPQYELLDSLYVLLRQMPRFRRGRGDEVATGREFDNMAEFLHYRSQWQLQCRQVPAQYSELFDGCKAVNPKTETGVRSALTVMGGDDEAALGTLTGGSWLELMIAELVHLRPNTQARQHLIDLIRHCQGVMPLPDSTGEGAEVLSLVSNLIEAMVDLEVQRVVEVLSSSGAVSPWFMAHMYEVMRGAEGGGGPRTSDVIGRPLVLFGGDQVEYWRLLFAEMLACQPSTAKLAVSYLSWCPIHGADAAEILLESLSVSEDAPSGQGQVHRLLHIAESHGLVASSSTAIRRAAGAAAWYQGRVGDAAAWMLRAHDDRRLAAVLEPSVLELSDLLRSGIGTYVTTSSSLSLASSDELETLLAALIVSQPSEPSARQVTLRDARKSSVHQASDDSSSVKLLMGVLQLQRAVQAVEALQGAFQQVDQSVIFAAHTAVRDATMGLALGGCVPRGLTLQLLFHVIPILEAPVLAFSPKDMQALIRWIIDFQLAQDSSGSDLSQGMHVRHIKDVQLALTRALARSSVYAN